MELAVNYSGPDDPAPALPTSRPDTYVVLNRLPPSRIEWLRQQSGRVAEVFRRSPWPKVLNPLIGARANDSCAKDHDEVDR
jgi:hypothetical protein